MNASVPARSKPSAGLRSGPARLPGCARLLRHSDFERVYQQGRRYFSTGITVFYLPRDPAETRGAGSGPSERANGRPVLRVGFTVGRALGGAVERNRIKRRLREAVRLAGPPQALNADVVINPKKTVLKVQFESLLNEVRRAFVVIEQKLGSASDVAGNAGKGTPEARK